MVGGVEEGAGGSENREEGGECESEDGEGESEGGKGESEGGERKVGCSVREGREGDVDDKPEGAGGGMEDDENDEAGSEDEEEIDDGEEEDKGLATQSKSKGGRRKGFRKKKQTKHTTFPINPTKHTLLVHYRCSSSSSLHSMRQIGIIYDDGHQDSNCGRCSNCIDDVVPEPRPLAEKWPAEICSDGELEDEGLSKVARKREIVARTEAFRCFACGQRHPSTRTYFYSPPIVSSKIWTSS